MDAQRACGPPPPEAVYTDISTAVAAIQAHAQLNGYALFKRDSTPRRIVYACDRSGKAEDGPRARAANIHLSKRRSGKTKKCGCRIKVAFKKDLISGSWTLSILEGTYNHESSADPTAHPTYRVAALDSNVIAQIKTLSAAGLAPASISLLSENSSHKRF